MRDERPTTAVIDLGAAVANLRLAAQHANGSELIAVVKADAYGHGAVPLARAFLGAGCERLAVVTVSEACELRDSDVRAPILLLGGIHGADEAGAAVALDLVPVVQDPGQLALLGAAARLAGRRQTVPVQVELDTGMARMGVPAELAPEFLGRIAAQEELCLQGLFTHLACADEPDLAPSLEQLRRFSEVLDAAGRNGIRAPELHVANSAGLLAGTTLAAALPEGISAARPGLMLYGVQPAPHLEAPLRPVMTLRTQIVAVRSVAAGAPVGYGASWCAPEAGSIGTLPVGYADGVPWSLANRGEVVHRGRRLPLVGRISMDYVTVFCSAGPLTVGDDVILFGGDGLSVEEQAAAAGTIPYELLVRVGERVPRIYLQA